MTTDHPGADNPGNGHPSAGHLSAGHPSAGHPSAGHPSAGHPRTGHLSLADRQAQLVAALTLGRPVPEGFDRSRVEAARVALLRKRAGAVAKVWPLLAAGLGADWQREFAAWASARPTRGAWRDGWDFARACRALPPPAAVELASREAAWRYAGDAPPAERRLPAVRFAAGAVVVQIFGIVRVFHRP
jgi:hypothetical protein